MSPFQSYIEMKKVIPVEHLAWPLYGPGLDSLGRDGKPVKRPVPGFSDDELLMRIDAVSLCYTDVKEINQGPNHPRLTGRDMEKDPIVPGHEISMTVAGVGKNLKGEYQVGDRFTLQPDVWVDGQSIPFCFGMDGGYRQYAKIGSEILTGDAGNYLIPIPDEMPYAASAITEPWACVEAAYRMNYRSHPLEGGRMWIIGCEQSRSGYQLGNLFDQSAPAEIYISGLSGNIQQQIVEICEQKRIPLIKNLLEDVLDSEQMFDDVVVLDCDTQAITKASKKMNKGAVFAILGHESMGLIEIDLGRLHYDNIFFTGTSLLDLSSTYNQTKPRAQLKLKGKTWIQGAGGPMGRMHLQRAIEASDGPALIVASEVTQDRYESLMDFFLPMAEEYHKELLIVNPKSEPDKYAEVMNRVLEEGGFDDIEVMVAIVPVIKECLKYPAERGVINLFAGLKRGTCMEVDPRLIFGKKQVRFVGHSGSGLDDQKAVVAKAVTGELRPELSVAAVGGFRQIAQGIRSMKEWVYPGKIVIYPHVLDYPLTGLPEFEVKDPDIYDALRKGETWTKKAEEIFLDKKLS